MQETKKKKPRRTVAAMIAHLYPCGEAKKWAKGYTSPAKAWAECKRGDWMLWLIGKHACSPESDSRKPLVLCACECARLALPHVAAGELRPLCAIEAAERWARGEGGTLDDVREAAYAAYAAAHAAAYAAHAAAHAADTAAYAAHAADAAAYAAAYAAYAAAHAADTAYAAAQAQCADIVRKHFPKPPKITKARRV